MTGTKEFSEGFLHDLADLLEMCSNNNTDTIEIKLTTLNEKENLIANITFSVEQKS